MRGRGGERERGRTGERENGREGDQPVRGRTGERERGRNRSKMRSKAMKVRKMEPKIIGIGNKIKGENLKFGKYGN